MEEYKGFHHGKVVVRGKAGMKISTTKTEILFIFRETLFSVH